MSKTVDDLIAVFEKARAEAAPFPQHHEDGLYAGVTAIVRALRDEFADAYERGYATHDLRRRLFAVEVQQSTGR